VEFKVKARGDHLLEHPLYISQYCVLDQAQAYVCRVNWMNYLEAREKIELDKANLTSDEGIPAFNRVLRMLSLSEFPA